MRLCCCFKTAQLVMLCVCSNDALSCLMSLWKGGVLLSARPSCHESLIAFNILSQNTTRTMCESGRDDGIGNSSSPTSKPFSNLQPMMTRMPVEAYSALRRRRPTSPSTLSLRCIRPSAGNHTPSPSTSRSTNRSFADPTWPGRATSWRSWSGSCSPRRDLSSSAKGRMLRRCLATCLDGSTIRGGSPIRSCSFTGELGSHPRRLLQGLYLVMAEVRAAKASFKI